MTERTVVRKPIGGTGCAPGSQLFDPANIDDTIGKQSEVGGRDEEAEVRSEAARWKLPDCNDRLAKYRAAVDGGADPVVVAGWMSEVHGERLRAEAELVVSGPQRLSQPMTCVAWSTPSEIWPRCSQRPIRRTRPTSTRNSASA
jgi:hypothetical protein